MRASASHTASSKVSDSPSYTWAFIVARDCGDTVAARSST